MRVSATTQQTAHCMQTPLLFTQAFRLFFPLAALYAAIGILAWLSGLSGLVSLPLAPTLWHAHEMLFGFAMAVVAGFVLTAAASWTGMQVAEPRWLLSLAILWIAGRLAAFWPDGLGAILWFVIDSLFLPGVAYLVSRVLLRSRNWRNALFIPLFWGLAGLNVAFHQRSLAGELQVARAGLEFTTYLLGFLMVFMGGRVIPFFTGRRCGYMPGQWAWLNWCTTLCALALAILVALAPRSTLTTGVALVAGLSTWLRLLYWQPWRAWHEPMLWVLHLGYAWLGTAFLLRAGVSVGWPANLAVHALMVGGLGCLGLGMLTRVAQGHSGRQIRAGPLMSLAFTGMLLAGLLRVAAYLPGSLSGLPGLTVSALLWVAAWSCYCLVIAPGLAWSPRASGPQP